MSDIPRMTYHQHRAAQRLVHECCNYDNGNCLALDNGDPCVCVQSISYSVLCKWFRAAVLPPDAALFTALFPPLTGKARRCRECGELFTAPRHNTLYCPICAKNRTKRSKREWARKMRGDM